MNAPIIAPRPKRLFSSLSCQSSSVPTSTRSSSEDNDDPPHKKLALSLTRLSLSSTPNPLDTEMRQRKSYEKDAFTTFIESLSTTSSDSEYPRQEIKDDDAPFPRDEGRVTIISEIEKRLNQFPHKLLTPSTSAPDTALVLYRSPESMGLPRLEIQRLEEIKNAVRKRILEKRRAEKNKKNSIAKGMDEVGDGYEADAEDWEDSPLPRHQNLYSNGIHSGHSSGVQGRNYFNGFADMDHGGAGEDEEDDGEMMDLD